jgi:hypothetical protein
MESQKKVIISRVNAQFLKELKMICIENDITINDLIAKLLVKEYPRLKEFSKAS